MLNPANYGTSTLDSEEALSQNPIHKALLTFRKCDVKFLLMGGQACILYGGAEFSRDLDLTIGITASNLDAVKKALDLLNAEQVFVPDLKPDALFRGHACHFRCKSADVEGLRIDLMAKMRNCPDFDILWEQRTIIEIPEIGEIGVMSLPHLVLAKKTQREKDWPMIRLLIEADVAQYRSSADQEKNTFWLLQCRTPELICELAGQNHDLCGQLVPDRPLLAHAISRNIQKIELMLMQEELDEKHKDQEYWAPLKKELEQWRLQRK
jgi:hypothetical protein